MRKLNIFYSTTKYTNMNYKNFNKKTRIFLPTAMLLTVILSLTIVVTFTSTANALTQRTRQSTSCSGDTCTTTTCVNGVCSPPTTTTNSGSSNQFSSIICRSLFDCSITTSP